MKLTARKVLSNKALGSRMYELKRQERRTKEELGSKSEVPKKNMKTAKEELLS